MYRLRGEYITAEGSMPNFRILGLSLMFGIY